MNSTLLRRAPHHPPPTDRRVSVCIPMRDEESNVPGCLAAVLACVGVGHLEVLVLDDGSTDHTADLVRAATTRDPRLRLVRGAELPDGWLGKPHACAQLAGAARGEVLVFLDADVRVAPNAIAGAVALMERHRLALVSPYPRQLAETAAERLVQPLLQWLWLTFVPLRLAESPRPASLTAANGQFLVIDRTAYDAIGGHGSVKAHVIDDVWLARAVKRAGYRVAVVDGTDLATCRMYDGWPALRDGYAKSLWAAFGSPAGAAGVCALLGLCFVVPPLAILTGPRRAGVVGTVAAVAGRAVAARRTGGRVGDAWMHPASIGTLIMLTARSVIGHRRGKLAWRGRPIP